MPARPKLLLVNHFDLATVCGTTVMFGEMLRLAPRAAPDIEIAYEGLESQASPAAWRARLDAAHADAACVVAANAHIEVSWELTEALFAWCRERGIPVCNFAFDLWPQHLKALRLLVSRDGARLLAATPFIAESLKHEGFRAELLDIGIPLPDVWPAPRTAAVPKVLASAARLVPRKRLADVVRGFAASGLDGRALLYLRALPSQVFGGDSDAAQLREIEDEIARGHLAGVTLDLEPGGLPDYGKFSAYVCTSSYEGFGMPVIEATFHGCPPLMTRIPPHVASARALFGERSEDFLFPVGDCRALGAMMRDEIETGRRAAFIESRLTSIREEIATRWSLGATARALGRLARGLSA